MKTDILKALDDANEIIEDFKNAILSNVVVRIKNEEGDIVWCCADDTWRDKKYKGFTVEQDVNMFGIIADLKKYF